ARQALPVAQAGLALARRVRALERLGDAIGETGTRPAWMPRWPGSKPFCLLTGLGAALAWGTLDIITALGSRVIGSVRVTAGMQFVSALLFVAILLETGTGLPTAPRAISL